MEDGGNNWRKSSLTICPDVLLKHKKPWGSTFCRVGAGMKLFSACWGLCVMWKMTYSHMYMALYSPCLKVLHPMDLAFSSKVKTCKKWPQLETRVVLPQNAFTYHKSQVSYEERQSQKYRSHPCAWHHVHQPALVPWAPGLGSSDALLMLWVALLCSLDHGGHSRPGLSS